jgi:hypothetical protein
MQALFTLLVLGDALGSSDVDWEEEKASSSSPKQIVYYTNTLEHPTIFMKCMINEHVYTN